MTSIIKNKYLWGLSGILTIILLYFIISTVADNQFIYPSYSKIFSSISMMISDKVFISAFFNSILKVIICISLSLLSAVVISLLYMLYKPSIYFFKPLIVIIKSSPLAILIIYLFISIGDEKAPYIITILMTIPICIEGFISALDNIDKALLLQLRTENVPMIRKFFQVLLPLIFPYIIMTILQTFGLGLKVMIMGEYICQSNNSLGEIIYNYKTTLSFDSLLGILILIVTFVLIIEIIIKLLSKKILKK